MGQLAHPGENVFTAAILLVLGAGLPGCAATSPGSPAGLVAERHLIFNPECTGTTPVWLDRGDWPSTIVPSNPGEELTYRETIIDWQGRSRGWQDQDYRRRFTSIRTSRPRR